MIRKLFKPVLLVIVIVFVVASMVGCSGSKLKPEENNKQDIASNVETDQNKDNEDEKIEDKEEKEDKEDKENKADGVRTVVVEKDSEIGQGIEKMNQSVYGENNKYKNPVVLSDDEFVGSWIIKGAQIDFLSNGRYQYSIDTGDTNVLLCQIGTYKYYDDYEIFGKPGEGGTAFLLTMEHIVVDDTYCELPGEFPYIVTGIKEENDLAVINLQSKKVSTFTKTDEAKGIVDISEREEISAQELAEILGK